MQALLPSFASVTQGWKAGLLHRAAITLLCVSGALPIGSTLPSRSLLPLARLPMSCGWPQALGSFWPLLCVQLFGGLHGPTPVQNAVLPCVASVCRSFWCQ